MFAPTASPRRNADQARRADAPGHMNAAASRSERIGRRFGWPIALALIAWAAPGLAQRGPAADPDWPCVQVKTASFALASVWPGPPLDLAAQAWRDDPEAARLVTLMSQRRTPTQAVETAISDFAARGGEQGKQRLLAAFAAAFGELTAQRAQIIEGLVRFGRKQREVADRIRQENEALQREAGAGRQIVGSEPSEAMKRLQWDIRLFEERRRSVNYVCETPALIERRIGVIARGVAQATGVQ